MNRDAPVRYPTNWTPGFIFLTLFHRDSRKRLTPGPASVELVPGLAGEEIEVVGRHGHLARSGGGSEAFKVGRCWEPRNDARSVAEPLARAANPSWSGLLPVRVEWLDLATPRAR
jgi:hypothetical protein